MCFGINGNILIVRFLNENRFNKKDQAIEKRIAITPELVKKYNSLGFEISLIKIMDLI